MNTIKNSNTTAISGLAKVVVQRSPDVFVINQTLALRINPEVSGW